MAVTDVRKTAESTGYSANREQIHTKYEVQTTDMSDTAADVATAVAALTIPDGFYITNLVPDRREQNPLWYDVSMTLDTMPWPDNQPVPTLRESILSSSYDEFTEAYFTDCSPTPKVVLTLAKERFENFPQRKNGNPVLQI